MLQLIKWAMSTLTTVFQNSITPTLALAGKQVGLGLTSSAVIYCQKAD